MFVCFLLLCCVLCNFFLFGFASSLPLLTVAGAAVSTAVNPVSTLSATAAGLQLQGDVEEVQGQTLAPAPPDAHTPLNADPLWCDMRGIAGYPIVAFEDARSPLLLPPGAAIPVEALRRDTADQTMLTHRSGSDTNSALAMDIANTLSLAPTPSSMHTPWRLWRQLGFRDINESLATPLSKSELRFNKQTQLSQNPEDLQQFSFEFTPAVIGTPAMVVFTSLRNVGKLATTVEFIFPNDLEVELEPWAEKGEPSDVEMLQNELVEEKIFDVQPRRKRLKPGEACTVRFHYNYTSLAQGGRHEVPVILKVNKGKQVCG